MLTYRESVYPFGESEGREEGVIWAKEVGEAILGMGDSLAMESVVAGIVEKGTNTSVLDLGVVVFAEDEDEGVVIRIWDLQR